MIGKLLIQHLLDKLERPYQYHAMSTAYCFGRGQWVHVRDESDVDQIIDENLESWLARLAEAGETERLTELAEYLNGLLKAEAEQAGNEEHEP